MVGILHYTALYGVTDDGILSLAEAGCGAQLNSLSLFVLDQGVTNEGLFALAKAGCGAKLTSLRLEGLTYKVTDDGVCALAEAGCGAQLTSLTLRRTPNLFTRGLKVTDKSLQALASAGCGPRLTSLTLSCLLGVSDDGLRTLAEVGCGEQLKSLRLEDLGKSATVGGLHALASAGCGARLTDLVLHGFPSLQMRAFPGCSDLQLFASHVCILASLGHSSLATVSNSLQRHVHPAFLPLIRPYCDSNFSTTLTLLLPADVWREVLEYADSVEYTSLTRVSAGVSKEFYWLLKNSLSTIRVHHPVSPLYGLVWLQSRDRFFSRVKRVEVAFRATGGDLEALFLFSGYLGSRPIRLSILPNIPHYCVEDLHSELAALGVGDVNVAVVSDPL